MAGRLTDSVHQVHVAFPRLDDQWRHYLRTEVRPLPKQLQDHEVTELCCPELCWAVAPHAARRSLRHFNPTRTLSLGCADPMGYTRGRATCHGWDAPGNLLATGRTTPSSWSRCWPEPPQVAVAGQAM